jgi:FecR protein
MTCPSDLELARAITTGDAEIAAHVDACQRCRATWDQTQAAIELARELPVTVPPAAHREEMRTALLARAEVPRRPARPVWLVPAVAIAAAAGLVGFVARPRGEAPAPVPAPVPVAVAGHHHGTVRPQPGARYLTGTPSPDEVVVLVEGALDIEVAPLHAGERYRVVVGSAEVEVRGTSFTITAREARLVGVRVAHGRVEIRSERGPVITLTAGQSWQPEVAAAPVVVAAPVVAPPPRPRAPRPAPRPPQVVAAPPPEAAPAVVAPARAPEEVAYDAAWRALRANDFTRAASGFSRVLLLAPDSALVEDASFWHAVALARAGRSAEAVSAFRDFLDGRGTPAWGRGSIDGYARSARAGEASTMLGWILIDRREDDEAARRFRAGLGDGNPAVRASAKAGLDAIARGAAIRSSAR